MYIFNYLDYKKLIIDLVTSKPKSGRGFYTKISNAIKTHPTYMSQIIHGDKHLSLEQACQLGAFLGFDSEETDFFVNLVEYNRAGSQALKIMIAKRLEKFSAEKKQIKAHLPNRLDLSETDKAVFYSEWFYSAVRLLTSIPNFNNAESIARHLNLPEHVVRSALDFLVQHQLCQSVGGDLKIGPALTHIDATSTFLNNHHKNWRLIGMTQQPHHKDGNLFFTAPFTASCEDIEEIRQVLLKTIAEVGRTVEPSAPQQLMCMNLDFFAVTMTQPAVGGQIESLSSTSR